MLAADLRADRRLVAASACSRRSLAPVAQKFVTAMKEGTTGVLNVAATCATAGIIVGVVTLTGLAQRFADIIIGYAQGSLLLTAIFTAAIVWIVGLAVPVTASYIMCAVIAAPAMIKLGVPDFAAHMFIFYYAVLSEVSPPTALSPFAAAAITGGNPYVTTLQSWKYTMPAFLVPFVFVLDPQGIGLLLKVPQGGSWLDIVEIFLETGAGIAMLAFAAQGWFLKQEHGAGDRAVRHRRPVLVFPGACSTRSCGRCWGSMSALSCRGCRTSASGSAITCSLGSSCSRPLRRCNAHGRPSFTFARVRPTVRAACKGNQSRKSTMELSKSISAVITGGASGLGAATARALAAKGVKVALLDLNADLGEKVAKELGGVFAKCDVTNESSVNEALAAVRKAHGQERILVNCAGIGIAKRISRRVKETGAFEPHDLATFTKVIHVNLIGTFLMMSKSAAGMQATEPVNQDGERGVMICTSSVAAQDGQIGQVAYSASKGGVYSMTLPVARDLAQSGIRVCTILPGLFLTPMFDNLSEEARKSLAASVPFPSRLGSPTEYGALAVHICENPMLNGECIRLDGALRMAPR